MYGQRIRELREEENKSQKQLAIITGIPQATIARYELEKTEPRVTEIKILCNYFNVTSDYLIGIE